MNQTVHLTNARLPVSFMVDEFVVRQLLENAQKAVNNGEVKTASEYVSDLLKWALENDMASKPKV